MSRVWITPYAYWDGAEIHIFRTVGKADKLITSPIKVWGIDVKVSTFFNKRRIKMYDICVVCHNLTWSQAVDLARTTYRTFSERIK